MELLAAVFVVEAVVLDNRLMEVVVAVVLDNRLMEVAVADGLCQVEQ